MSNTSHDKIVSIIPAENGKNLITIQFYTKTFSAITSDTALCKKYKSREYGWKQAGDDLYQYVKACNNLLK